MTSCLIDGLHPNVSTMTQYISRKLQDVSLDRVTQVCRPNNKCHLAAFQRISISNDGCRRFEPELSFRE